MSMVTARTNMAALEESIADLEREQSERRSSAVALAQDQSASMEDVRAARVAYDEVGERLAVLRDERERLADEAAFRLQRQNGGAMSRREAASLFYRTALTDGNMRSLPQMAYEQLGMIPADNDDQGHGSVLIPQTLSSEILLAPVTRNPLRELMSLSQIPNLRIPRMGFVVEDDAFQKKDGESAKEMKIRGELVSFGNNEFRVKARVAESLLRTTNLDIEGTINEQLSSAAAAKELKLIFAESPSADEKHMSLYQKGSGATDQITVVKGADLYSAWLAAFADLEDAYRDNAAGVMRFSDYVQMLRAIAPNASLFDAAPERVLGVPIKFTERAVKPVVGDFKYLHLNHGCAPWYDVDKDTDHGLRLFVLNSLYDIQVKMFAAFRIAEVSADSYKAGAGQAVNAGGPNQGA